MNLVPQFKGEIKLQTIVVITIMLVAGCFLLWVNTPYSTVFGSIALILAFVFSIFAFVDVSVGEKYEKIIKHYDKLARTHQTSLKSFQRQTETAQQPDRSIGGEEDGYRVKGQETLTD